MEALGLLFGLAAAVYFLTSGIITIEDQTRRAMLKSFGKVTGKVKGPGMVFILGNGIWAGYDEVDGITDLEVPAFKVNVQNIDLTLAPSLTLKLGKDNAEVLKFVERGGWKKVKEEIGDIITDSLQEFIASATDPDLQDYKGVKKSQTKLMLEMIRILTGEELFQGMADDERNTAIKKLERDLSRGNGKIVIENFGVEIVRLDIGRISEPQSIDEAAKRKAEADIENAMKRAAAEQEQGIKLLEAEAFEKRLAILRTQHPDASLKELAEILQVQEGTIPKTLSESKVVYDSLNGQPDPLGKVLAGITVLAKGMVANKTTNAAKTGGKGAKS